VGSAGIAVTPDQGPVAAFTASPAPHASPTKFNAGASHDPDGQIVKYAWSFGDGTRASSATPTISHAYKQAGKYHVTLTVTDNAGASTTVVFTGHQVLLNGTPAAGVTHTVTIP
jgi:PKD repeat protein